MRWWQQAADAGCIDAMMSLAANAGSREQAVRWWKQAANAGNRRAMLNLGLEYKDQANVAEAEPWLWRAANAGNTAAMLALAVLLHQIGREAEVAQWAERGYERALREVDDSGDQVCFGQLLQEVGREQE